LLILPPEVRQERLISNDYRRQQEELHKDPNYGTASIHYAPLVARVINQYQVDRMLDYGAGKGNLFKTLVKDKLLQRPLKVQHYEPSNPEWAFEPDPCEMVACIDVLEHVEPHLIENVLDDLQRVTQRIGAFSIATEPAMKTLPDGRNAHLIVEDMGWWLPKILERFDLHVLQRQADGFFVLVMAKEKAIQ
jgi:hypothetical protein